MIEQIYVAQNSSDQQVIERREVQESERGMMHSKQAFRYEVVNVLPEEAGSFNEAFDYATLYGKARLAWIDTDLTDEHHTTATALGGVIGFDTASYSGFALHVAAYTSQKLPLGNSSKNGLNGDFFDADGRSFTYMAEANLHYVHPDVTLKAGRLLIDTPYADSDDIRMAANTFEGAWARFNATEKVSMQLYYLSRWAGFDSGVAQEEFKPLYESENGSGYGLIGASLDFSINSDDTASLWYYHVDRMSDIIYAEVAGHYGLDDKRHIEFGLQGSVIRDQEGSRVNGNVVGLLALFDLKEFFFGCAGNYAFVSEGDSITDGFGGGPYYTSLDESTIGFVSEQAVGENILSTRLGVGGVLYDSLTVEAVHGQIKSQNAKEWYKENNLILTYEHDETLSMQGVFANFTVHESQDKDSNQHFDRFVIRADYNF